MNITAKKRALFFIISDIFLSLLSLYVAYLLRFNFYIPQEYISSLLKLYFLITPIKLFFLNLFGQYRFTWRFYGVFEAKKLLISLLITYSLATLIIASFYSAFIPFPRSVILLDLFLSILFLGALRVVKRFILESLKHPQKEPALLIGATNKAKQLIESFKYNELDYQPVAIVDDKKKGDYIAGIPIIKEDDIQHYNSQSAIIAQDITPKELQKLTKRLKKKGIKEIKIASLTKEAIIKDIDIEDLLARKPKDLDLEKIRAFLSGKKVLITGAGGSIGSELVRQCKELGSCEIVAVENSEYALYTIHEEIPSIIPKLCDVTDKEAISKTIKEYRPDIIIHAAAYKHVPLTEYNPKAAIKNNILGTKNVIDASIEARIKRFVLISTDKAVNPTNIMGATKRVCELYAQNIPANDTIISAVRFGNVLGSSGSVIPKFKAQIQNNQPITVTHPEITRYFMLISEACQLVLQSATIAKDKELFILDMGKPVKIVDLAKMMMELYNKEVPIKFIGLRPGEKLFEELLLEGVEEKTIYESIYIASKTPYPFEELQKDIEALFEADEKDIVLLLKKIVPEFNHTPHR